MDNLDLSPFPHRSRRRQGRIRDAFGLSAPELIMLRQTFVRVISKLNDTQLTMSGDAMRRYLVDRHALLGLAPADVPAKANGIALAPAELRDLAASITVPGRAPRPSPLEKRLRALGKILALETADLAIVGVMARLQLFDSWRDLASLLPFRMSNPTCAALAILTGLSAPEVDMRLSPGSPLIRTGMVRDDGDGEFRASSLLQRIARSHWDDPETLRSRLMPCAAPSSLAWEDFEHVGPATGLAARVLQAGEPVSLLLHGAPGTGKSEFARLLAASCGRQAVFAGLADDRGREPDRRERLEHLALLRAMARNDPRTLIVVDEADDVLRLIGSRESAGSKLWRNLLVEAPEAPTVWILNDPERIDPALVRRMTLAVAFQTPPAPVRARIARRAAESEGLALNEAEVSQLAAIEAEPAIIAGALRAARLSSGGGEAARLSITGVLRALGRRTAPPASSGGVYDPALSAADADLADLSDRLCNAPGKGWSLLLSGPSGTGKSAYARHLAQRMGLEVEEARGSDLLGPFVGQTEANIARAFERAGERGAMLLIDEADSFLFRREAGQRSWETGMVNEMLRHMEHLRAPFVATTNLADRLDPAMQRRFTLRAAFRCMDERQTAALFTAYFGTTLPPGTPALTGQTPGDFAVIARRATLLGETRAEVLAGWLREEATLRGEVRAPLGF